MSTKRCGSYDVLVPGRDLQFSYMPLKIDPEEPWCQVTVTKKYTYTYSGHFSRVGFKQSLLHCETGFVEYASNEPTVFWMEFSQFGLMLGSA